MIISAQYWDQLKDKAMKLPIKIINQLEQYNQNYKTVKTSPSLHWVPQSGSVELELEFCILPIIHWITFAEKH